MKTIAHLGREGREIIDETHAVVGDQVTIFLRMIGLRNRGIAA